MGCRQWAKAMGKTTFCRVKSILSNPERAAAIMEDTIFRTFFNCLVAKVFVV